MCYHGGVTLARPNRLGPPLVTCAVLVAGALVHAAPIVEIKAKTALSLTRVRVADEGSVDVVGQLVDQLTGDGLTGQPVDIAIGDRTVSSITGPNGTFEARVPAPPGAIRVTLSYGGDRLIDRAAPIAIATDPSKRSIQLAVEVTEHPAGASVHVTAVGENGPITVPIALAIAATAAETWTPIAPATKTFAVHTVARRDVGGPGLYRLRATFAGDVRTQPAVKDAVLELSASTTTTMTLGQSQLAYEDRLGVTGRVLDADSQPVAGAAIALTSADRRIAHTATANDGTYRFSIKGEALGEGTISLQVAADPGRSYLKPSRSDPRDIAISKPHPVPVWYTIAGFAATGLVAAAFFVARRAPWRRFGDRLMPTEVALAASAAGESAGGLVAAKPGIVSTLRRAADDSFSGVVRDSVRNRPIANAVIRIANDQTGYEAVAATDGSFTVSPLSVGQWRVAVSADGHVTEQFAIAMPHRGEFRGVRIDLVPVREKAFQLYRRVAEPTLPHSRLWGIWSPRQIVDHVRTKRPSPALQELTNWIEEIYFSPRIASEGVLAELRDGVARAQAESTRRG